MAGMDESKPDQYGVEPGAAPQPPVPQDDAPVVGETSGSAGPRLSGGTLLRGGHVEPLPLEDEADVPPAQRSVKDLDVCPNCGGSMRGGDQIVCMRCGFDMKTMKVISPVVGPPGVGPPTTKKEKEEDADEASEREPLVAPGLGDFWLPGAIAAVSGIVLIVAYLAGVVGLFPALEGAAAAENRALEIGFMQRVEGLGQEAILIGLWWACGMGALIIVATILGKRLGDGALASMRMLGIIAAMRLAAIVNFSGNAAEFIVEAVLALAIFAGLSIALFRLKPRDAVTLTVAGLASYLILWLLARLVVMAT